MGVVRACRRISEVTTASSWPRVAQGRDAQEGSKTRQEGPDRVGALPRGPKRGPGGHQDGPDKAPRRMYLGAHLASPRSISSTRGLGPSWGPLGAFLRPS
eukprot:2290734-Pyramimonas_sp.AAC.1